MTDGYPDSYAAGHLKTHASKYDYLASHYSMIKQSYEKYPEEYVGYEEYADYEDYGSYLKAKYQSYKEEYGNRADHETYDAFENYYVAKMYDEKVDKPKKPEKPENEAPIANDDKFFIEFGDSELVDVLANDEDPDGTLDPSTLSFSGAASGTAVEELGQLRYTADTIDFDTDDSSVSDEFTYTVDDTEGATSNAATVTAHVIDPLRETAIDSSEATATGQLITLQLSTEDRTFNDTSFVEVDISSGPVDQGDINVSFVIDGSGSIAPVDYAEQVQAVQNTVDELRADFDGTGVDIEVQLVQFSLGAASASLDLFDPILDDIAAGGTPLTPQQASLTNYEAGLGEAVSFFTGQGADENFLLFTSDGFPNEGGPFDDEVAVLESLNVSRTAVGFGTGIDTATLDLIDNTGGSEIVADASELSDVFGASPLFPADLVDFSLTLNGVEIFGLADLTDEGGGSFSLEEILMGLPNDLGDSNSVLAVAEFDIDNDGVADETRTAETLIDGTDGSDVLFA